jgi:tRNA threonylcarbamoyladenosine biosynthesis protein TsaB
MLLALDTSTRTVGVALYDGEQVLSEIAWTSKDYHTAELAPVVAEVLDRPGVQFSELNALAVALGPGSFTGLRVGLSLAKGLSLANHLALIGAPTLDVLAAAQPVHDLPMAAILRIGRGRLAVGWYLAVNGTWQPSGAAEALTAAELAQGIQQPTVVCGELTVDERRLLARKRKNVLLTSPALSMRRPAYLAEIGWQRWLAGKVDDPASLAPIYLHYGDPVPG